MPKRVLVTGATGFVGANLARRLLNDGHEVHLIVRTNHRAWRIEQIQNHVQLHYAPLTDANQLSETVLKIKPEWVFHLAAYGAYSSQTDLHEMIQTNITGTATLVQACLPSGFEVFINTGSSSEYGFKDHPPVELDRVDPNSHYAVTKASATQFCRYTAEHEGVRIPTLRLYSVYGPYEEPTRLMPTLIRYGRQGTLPPLVNPHIARDFIYIDDVCDAYIQCATKPTDELGAIFNVGTGVQTTIREAVDVARTVFNLNETPQWGSMQDRQWDTGTWVSNPQKMMHELNWTPRYSFEDGFQHMVHWFDNTGINV